MLYFEELIEDFLRVWKCRCKLNGATAFSHMTSFIEHNFRQVCDIYRSKDGRQDFELVQHCTVQIIIPHFAKSRGARRQIVRGMMIEQYLSLLITETLDFLTSPDFTEFKKEKR